MPVNRFWAQLKEKCGYLGKHRGIFSSSTEELERLVDGGVIVTDDQELAEKLQLLRNHGLVDRDTVGLMGYNSRLDTIQAIVGNWLLPQTGEIARKRIKTLPTMTSNLENSQESRSHLVLKASESSITSTLSLPNNVTHC